MVVKVFPVRPIPGILPKNKWIDSPITLDLNKNEIRHCMQYGHVYDENGKVIDNLSILNHDIKVQSNVKAVNNAEVEPIVIKEISKDNKIVETPKVAYIVDPISVVETNEVETVEEDVVEETVEEATEEELVEETIEEDYFKLKEISCIKDDKHIILELEMDTNSKLEGTLYGLFSITSGSKPNPLEFKVNDEWTKFNNKFADFTSIENGAKFIFRFSPKNENEFGYKILIKQANNVLVSFEDKVNPKNL